MDYCHASAEHLLSIAECDTIVGFLSVYLSILHDGNFSSGLSDSSFQNRL